MDKNQFVDFINDFIDEYARQITTDVFLKLVVLKEYLNGQPPREIKKKLNDIYNHPKQYLEDSPYLMDAFNSGEFKKEVEKYDTKHNDNKKISRITSKYEECKEIYIIPRLIHITKLVDMIKCRYPRPSLIGFPFNDWTPKRLRKYISLRFNIIKEEDKISIYTINSALNNLYKKHSSLLTYDEGKDCKYYYIYLKEEHYPVLMKDTRKDRRYNRTLFAFVFYLDDYEYKHYKISYPNIIKWINRCCYKKECHHKICYTKECHYKLPYDRADRHKTMYNSLHKLFSKIYDYLTKKDKDKKEKPIFIIADEKPFSNFFRIRNYNALSELPKYSYILVTFSNYPEAPIPDSEELEYLNSKIDVESLIKIRKLVFILREKHLIARNQTNEFLLEMKETINNFFLL